MKTSKRLLAILLTLAMTLSLFPVAAFAEWTEEHGLPEIAEVLETAITDEIVGELISAKLLGVGSVELAKWDFGTTSPGNLAEYKATSGTSANMSAATAAVVKLTTDATITGTANSNIGNIYYGTWAAGTDWLIQFNPEGATDLTLTYKTFGTASAPKSWEVLISTNGTNYSSLSPAVTYTLPATAGSITSYTTVTAPLAGLDSATSTVYIKITHTDNTAANNNNRLFDITITGEPGGDGGDPTKSDKPTASPSSGSVLNGGTIELDATDYDEGGGDTKIYYGTGATLEDITLDTDTLTNNTEYTESITATFAVGVTTFAIKAIAVEDGKDPSDIATFTYTQTKSAAPTASPVTNTAVYEGAVITLTAATGAAIYYEVGTVAGDTNAPTTGSASAVTSTTFKAAFGTDAAVGSTYVIKAMTVEVDKAPSDVTVFTYTKKPPTLAEWDLTGASGTSVAATGGYCEDAALQMIKSSTPATLGFTSGGVNVSALDGQADSAWWLVTNISTKDFSDLSVSWSMRSSGTGPRDFQLQYSLDGTTWVNVGDPIVVPNGQGITTAVAKFTRTLPAAAADKENISLRWLMTSNASANNGTIATAGTHQINYIAIAGTESSTAAVRKPSASIASGSAVKMNAELSLSCPTPGAGIWYTTDGSTPSKTNGTEYLAPITLTSFPATIKVIAIDPNNARASSEVVTLTYTQRKVGNVAAAPASGETTAPLSVTLAKSPLDSDLTVSIFYSTDGNAPTTPYTGAISVASLPTTIKVVMRADGCIDSDIATLNYVAEIERTSDGEEGDIATWSAGYITAPGVALVEAGDGEYRAASNLKLFLNGAQTNIITSANGFSATGMVTGDNYWLLTTSTKGMMNISIDLSLRSSNTGPRYFKLQYSIDGNGWSDVQSSELTLPGDATVGSFTTALPNALADKDVLYLRVTPLNNTSVNGGTAGSGGTTQINSIKINGKYIIGGNQVYPAVPSETGAVYPGTEITFTSQTGGTTFEISADGENGWAPATSVPVTTFPYTFYVRAVEGGKNPSRVKKLTYTELHLANVKASKTSGPVYAGAAIALTHSDLDAVITYTLTRNVGGVGGTETVVVANADYETPITLLANMFPVKIVAQASCVIGSGTATSVPVTFEYTQREGSGEFKNYFGQLHAHTNNSDGAGTLAEAYRHAATVAKVDFLAVTDHSNSYDTASSSDKAGTYNLTTYNANNSVYKAGRDLIQSINRNKTYGSFIALYGYEMTWSGGPGHINTFNTTGFVSRNNAELNGKNNDSGMKAYYELLKTDTQLATSQFNHPGTTFGNFSNFAYYDEEIDAKISLIEVGNGEGAIGSGGYFPSYEQYTMALDRGWHVAPTNNQDNHKGLWGDSNTARSVVYTDNYTHDGIMQALVEMRVYATEDKNLDIAYLVNDEPLGTTFESAEDPVNFSITVTDPDLSDKVATVELVTNGGKIYKKWGGGGDALNLDENGDFTADFAISDLPDGYYYVRVVQTDSDIAVTAPVWFGTAALAGITSLDTTTAVPVTNEAIPLELSLFNNEALDATITSLTVSVKGGSKVYTETLTTENNTVTKLGGTKTFAIPYTTASAGTVTLVAEVVMEIGGNQLERTMELTLKVRDASKMVYIGIDGAHYNEYVTGNYKDSMTNFANLAAMYDVRVNILYTKDDLIAALANPQYKAFIFTAPSRRLYQVVPEETTVANPNSYKNYEDDVINAIATFAEDGGTLIFSGWSSTYENYSGLTNMPTDNFMSSQQNKVLAKLDSTLRISADASTDTLQWSSATDQYRLYLTDAHNSYNWESSLLNTVVGEQQYSHYGGSTIYAVSGTNKGAWNATASSALEDSVTPAVSLSAGGGSSVNRYTISFTNPTPYQTVPKYDGQYMVLASETVTHVNGKTSEVIVGGGSFMSNFEIQADLDNWDSLTYSNFNILENIIASIAKKSTIAEVKTKQQGEAVIIEGIATTNPIDATDPNTGFFDCIYVQDDTGGINLFPIASGVKEGQKIRVIGEMGAYQDEIQIQVSRVVVIDKEENPVTPTALSTAASMLPENTGKLVKTSGVITEITEDNGVVGQIMFNDDSGAARAYINAYITPGVDLSHLAVGDTVIVTGLASVGENFSSLTEFLPRLRVRDRNEIVFHGYLVNFVTNGGTEVKYDGAEVSYIKHYDGEGPITIASASEIPTTRSGYNFGGWYLDSALTVPAVFPLENGTIDTKITLYAKWTAIPSTPGPSDPTPTPTPPTDYVPAEVADVSDGGKASSTVNTDHVKDFVEQIKDNPSPVVVIKTELPTDTKPEDIRTMEITIPAESMNAISGINAGVSVETPISTVTFDTKAIDTIMNADGGAMTLTVEVVAKEDLNVSEKELDKIGDRPVYNFTVTKGETEVSHFQGGKATIAIPYTPTPDENTNAIVVWYIDSDGKLKTMRGHYDEATGCVIVVTTHFSKYAIAYNPVNFDDVLDGNYYKTAIEFLAAREIVNGIGNNMYSGGGNVTRGMFLVLVMRAYGIDLDSADLADNFTDAGNAYYTEYLATGKRMGIVDGVGNNLYQPDKAITRQEMFALVYNALNAIGELPSSDNGKTLDDYLDTDEIASWAKTAIETLVKAELVNGDGTNLTPKELSNRDQMAQMMYNILTK